MDSSIWGPPENQDESCYPANCWQYNLYFDPWLDVIEQDALNEISCLQVLKILITKADSEIAELEDEILMLQSQLACACADKESSDMCFAVLYKKIDNLESLLRALKNENEQGVVGIDLMNPSSDVAHHPSRYLEQKSLNFYMINFSPSSKRTHKGVKAVQIHDKKTSKQFVKINMASIKSISGIKGQEVVCTETDCIIDDSLPNLLKSKRNDRSKPLKKLKRGGDGYGDNTIKKTQLAGAKRAAGFADISATSQFHWRKRSKFSGPDIQENKDQRNVQNRLVKSHGRTSHEPLVIHGSSSYDDSNADNVKIVSPMSSIIPSPWIEDIYNMTVVQLRAMANQLKIYGVSKTRKADLQELLRSELQAKVRSL